MGETTLSRISDACQRHEAALVTDWLTAQKAAPTSRPDSMKEGELREQSRELLHLLTNASCAENTDIAASDW